MKSRTAFVVLSLLMFAFSVSAQDGGKPRLSISSLEHSFGSVKAGTPLTYVFQIKNEGKADLEIKSVSPSCGCTTSKYDKVIAPGKVGTVTLSVEKTDSYRGEITKTAGVTTNDPDHQTNPLGTFDRRTVDCPVWTDLLGPFVGRRLDSLRYVRQVSRSVQLRTRSSATLPLRAGPAV